MVPQKVDAENREADVGQQKFPPEELAAEAKESWNWRSPSI